LCALQRFYTVRVSAKDNDNAREIGSGTVGRAIVSVGKFMEKTKFIEKTKRESGEQ